MKRIQPTRGDVNTPNSSPRGTNHRRLLDAVAISKLRLKLPAASFFPAQVS